MTLNELVCPECRGKLRAEPERLTCDGCAANYSVEDGIARMAPVNSGFYEGKFVAGIPDGQKLKDRLRHLLLRRLRFLHSTLQATRAAKGPLRILDLACGGGHQMLARYGEVVGVDLSYRSLLHSRRYYNLVATADACKLPFANASFDVVVAMDFFGHVPVQRKADVLCEIERVLRPGGRTIQYIETLGNNSMQRLARRSPQLYEKYFIEPQGHVGLEPPRTVLERFYSNGLVPVQHIGAYKSWLRPPAEISYRFGGEYTRKHPWLALPVLADQLISRFGVTRFIGVGISEILSTHLDRLFPTEMADGLFLEAVKK